MQSIQLATFDVDTLRTRLRKMSDKELREFGTAARHMVSPKANMGKPPLPAFVLQLEEARAEWRRRHKGLDFHLRRIPRDVTGERVGCTDSEELLPSGECTARSAAVVLR
jgi:hypothetical protein